ncbi:MAG: hypothetical protein JXB45_03195 [Candidatus Krumholzibacteriota bacterium]|nr:hypothetical protein [Candidatus Krumholzibacteriota bacterium]
MDLFSPYALSRSRAFKVCCVVLVFSLVLSSGVFAQNYDKVKLILKNGVTTEGKYLYMDNKSIKIVENGFEKSYRLEEVNTAMAKESKAGKYALAFGAGCATLCLITIVANSSDDTSEYETSDLIPGAIIWTGIFAGIGALWGNSAEHWDTLYVAPAGSSLSPSLDLHLSQSANGTYRLGLEYRF